MSDFIKSFRSIIYKIIKVFSNFIFDYIAITFLSPFKMYNAKQSFMIIEVINRIDLILMHAKLKEFMKSLDLGEGFAVFNLKEIKQ